MFESKFVEYNGTTQYIGTEHDLYKIVEDNCGTDVADFVNDLAEKANQYAILEDEKWELEDKLGGTEIELEELEEEYEDLQEKYKRIEKFYNKVKDFVNDNYIKTDKTAEWLKELKEAKRLLKLAAEDIHELLCDRTDVSRGKGQACNICSYISECNCCNICEVKEELRRWRHEAEAEKLLNG